MDEGRVNRRPRWVCLTVQRWTIFSAPRFRYRNSHNRDQIAVGKGFSSAGATVLPSLGGRQTSGSRVRMHRVEISRCMLAGDRWQAK